MNTSQLSQPHEMNTIEYHGSEDDEQDIDKTPPDLNDLGLNQDLMQSSNELKNLDTAHFGAENGPKDNNDERIFKSHQGVSAKAERMQHSMRSNEKQERDEDQRLLYSLEKRITLMDNQETEKKNRHD